MQKKKKPRSMLKEMALTLLGLTLGLFVLLLILGWEYPATLHALDRGKTEGCTSTVLRLEENYRPLGRWYSDRHYFACKTVCVLAPIVIFWRTRTSRRRCWTRWLESRSRPFMWCRRRCPTMSMS